MSLLTDERSIRQGFDEAGTAVRSIRRRFGINRRVFGHDGAIFDAIGGVFGRFSTVYGIKQAPNRRAVVRSCGARDGSSDGLKGGEGDGGALIRG